MVSTYVFYCDNCGLEDYFEERELPDGDPHEAKKYCDTCNKKMRFLGTEECLEEEEEEDDLDDVKYEALQATKVKVYKECNAGHTLKLLYAGDVVERDVRGVPTKVRVTYPHRGWVYGQVVKVEGWDVVNERME